MEDPASHADNPILHGGDNAPGTGPALDPVCGMTVDPATAKWTADVEGRTWYFCSQGCRDKFVADPAAYRDTSRFDLKLPMSSHGHAGHDHAAPVSEGTKWTCPMHPEMVDFTRRLWISGALSLPLLVLAMAPMVGLPLRQWIGETLSGWIELVLATPVVLWAAQPFFVRFWHSLQNRSPNMWTLIGLGVGAAYLFSIAALLVPDLFPMSAGMDGPPLYFEASSVIVALVFLGQVMELRARAETGKSLRALLDLAPKTARVIHGEL